MVDYRDPKLCFEIVMVDNTRPTSLSRKHTPEPVSYPFWRNSKKPLAKNTKSFSKGKKICKNFITLLVLLAMLLIQVAIYLQVEILNKFVEQLFLNCNSRAISPFYKCSNCATALVRRGCTKREEPCKNKNSMSNFAAIEMQNYLIHACV